MDASQRKEILRFCCAGGILERKQEEARFRSEKIDDFSVRSRGQPENIAGVQKRDVLAPQSGVQIGVGKSNQQGVLLGCGLHVVSSHRHLDLIDTKFVGLKAGDIVISGFRRILALFVLLRTRERTFDDLFAEIVGDALRVPELDGYIPEEQSGIGADEMSIAFGKIAGFAVLQSEVGFRFAADYVHEIGGS